MKRDVADNTRSIGAILVANGHLQSEDANRVALRQLKSKQQFGAAAVAMKLVSQEELAFALAQQFDYAYLSPQDTSLNTDLVAAYKPFSHAGESLRAVRSQLRLRWLNTARSRKVLAVVSPAASEGRSFVAANLAIVFAQHGERTLLIDGDLRSARQQELFRLHKSAGLSGILSGRADLRAAMTVAGLPGLIVLPSGPVPPNPQELLGRVAFTALLQAAIQQFDVIIIDTPRADEFADAEIVAAAAGAALMVARKNKTVLPKAAELARRLQNNGVDVIGSVLNDA